MLKSELMEPKKNYVKHLSVRKTGLSPFVYYFTSKIDTETMRRFTFEEFPSMVMGFGVP
jgi:hypothetical protein